MRKTLTDTERQFNRPFCQMKNACVLQSLAVLFSSKQFYLTINKKYSKKHIFVVSTFLLIPWKIITITLICLGKIIHALAQAQAWAYTIK